jgi:hypothetical protein
MTRARVIPLRAYSELPILVNMFSLCARRMPTTHGVVDLRLSGVLPLERWAYMYANGAIPHEGLGAM